MSEFYYGKNFPKIDAKKAQKALVEFIKKEVGESPYDQCIMGLSGGLDSAVVAYLLSAAVGNRNLIGLLMPYKTSTSDVMRDARKVAKSLDIQTLEIDISPQIEAFKTSNPYGDPRRLGSKMVRERSAVLYYYADFYKAVVVGTANKTEVLLGYFTKWGDPAADILPLAGFYKTHVRQLARALRVPNEIIEKPPSAGMWPGQKDEDEFGFTYDQADNLLYYICDLNYSPERLQKMGYDLTIIKKISNRVEKNRFKRKAQIKPSLPKNIFLK